MLWKVREGGGHCDWNSKDKVLDGADGFGRAPAERRIAGMGWMLEASVTQGVDDSGAPWMQSGVG